LYCEVRSERGTAVSKISTDSCIGSSAHSAVSHCTWTASPGRPSADANWSMIPEFTPTKRTSARCDRSASSSRGRVSLTSVVHASAIATSSAAEELSPAPAGTSLQTATSQAGTEMPARTSSATTPAR
jgi:hypothetical protein